MKRLLLLLFLLLIPCTALGDLGEYDPSPEEIARRMEALRYSLSPASALDASDIAALLEQDLFDQPITSTDLFQVDADFGPLPVETEILMGSPIQDAAPLAWQEARDLLSKGASYTLTDQSTGAMVRVRYAGEYQNAAVFQPLTSWDAATLGSIFSDSYDFRLITCMLSVGSSNYLAGVGISPEELDAESGAPLLCRLYFEGSAPTLGTLTGLGMQ